MEEKAIRGVPWTFLGLGVNKVVATLTTVVLARLVAPTEFGLMAIATIAINLLFWFGGNSFGAAVVVHQDLDRRQQGTVFSLAMGGASLAALLCLGLAPLAASALHQPRLTAVIAVLAVAVLLSGVVSFYELLLQRELEFRRRFAALAIQTVTFSVVAIALAASGAGVWSLVVGQLASMVAFAVALTALAPYRVMLHWDTAVARRVFGTGMGFFSQGVTQFLRQNSDTVLVGRVFSAASVGYYSMAFRLGDLTYSAITDPLARVTFPAFARSHARAEDVRPTFLTALRLVALVTIPIGIALSAAAQPFTEFVFGPDWAPMAAPLAVVGIWSAIRPIEASIGWLMNSLGRAGAVGWIALVVLVPLLIGLAFALSSGHLAVVACVPLADTLISLTMLTVLARRHVGLELGLLWNALRVLLVGAVADWVVTRLVAEALGGHGALVALAGSVVAGLAVFMAAVVSFDRAMLRTVVTQVGRVLGRSPAAEAVS